LDPNSKARLEWTTCYDAGGAGFFPPETAIGLTPTRWASSVAAQSNVGGAGAVTYSFAPTVDFYTTLQAYFSFDNTHFSAVNSAETETNNDVTYATGAKFGSHSGRFGANSLLRFDVPSALIDSQDFTIAFWYQAGSSQFSDGLPKSLFSSGVNKVQLTHTGTQGGGVQGTGLLRFSIGVSDVLDINLDDTTANIFEGEWIHVAAVKDSSSSEMKIYLTTPSNKQASLVGFRATTAGFISDSVAIIGNGFAGYIDDFAIYDKALYDSEITVALSGVKVQTPGCDVLPAATYFAVLSSGTFQIGTELDKERCEYYALTIKASSTSGAGTDVGYCTVPIQVKDENDAPFFTTPSADGVAYFNFEVPEKSLINTPATDSDTNGANLPSGQKAWRTERYPDGTTFDGGCTADDEDVGQGE
jgi:hypothetical protein